MLIAPYESTAQKSLINGHNLGVCPCTQRTKDFTFDSNTGYYYI